MSASGSVFSVTSVTLSPRPFGRRSSPRRCQIARRSAIGTRAESIPTSAAARRMNGKTVVATHGPPALPDAATVASRRSVRRIYGSVTPPTQSTAPAQRSASKGRVLSGVTSARSMTAAAPKPRNRSASFGFPVAATTS